MYIKQIVRAVLINFFSAMSRSSIYRKQRVRLIIKFDDFNVNYYDLLI